MKTILIAVACVLFGISTSTFAAGGKDQTQNPVPTSAPASDVEVMSGRWTWSGNTPYGYMSSEAVMSRDGTFQQLTTSSFAKVLVNGRWEIVSHGMYRVHNDRWQPTQDNAGNPINMPKSESHTYRILDRNRMLVDGKNVWTRGSR